MKYQEIIEKMASGVFEDIEKMAESLQTLYRIYRQCRGLCKKLGERNDR